MEPRRLWRQPQNLILRDLLLEQDAVAALAAAAAALQLDYASLELLLLRLAARPDACLAHLRVHVQEQLLLVDEAGVLLVGGIQPWDRRRVVVGVREQVLRRTAPVDRVFWARIAALCSFARLNGDAEPASCLPGRLIQRFFGAIHGWYRYLPV